MAAQREGEKGAQGGPLGLMGTDTERDEFRERDRHLWDEDLGKKGEKRADCLCSFLGAQRRKYLNEKK